MPDILKHLETTATCPVCSERLYFDIEQNQLQCKHCDSDWSWQSVQNKPFSVGLTGSATNYATLRKLLADEAALPGAAKEFPAYTSQMTSEDGQAIRIAWLKKPDKEILTKLLYEYFHRIGGE